MGPGRGNEEINIHVAAPWGAVIRSWSVMAQFCELIISVQKFTRVGLPNRAFDYLPLWIATWRSWRQGRINHSGRGAYQCKAGALFLYA